MAILTNRDCPFYFKMLASYHAGLVLILLTVCTVLLVAWFDSQRSDLLQGESKLSRVLQSQQATSASNLPAVFHEARVLTRRAEADNAVGNKQRKKVHKQNYIPYSEAENVVRKVGTKLGDFITYSPQAARTKPYIKSSVLKLLQQCPTPATQPVSCKETMNDKFISSWKKRKASDLCEENAASKINCFDSYGKSRFCIFENAMMNFQKVRKKKVDGHTARSWERGFLSAECGDMAPDDIGYLPLYKPDIEGREDAVCDYVFNETVLAYSHENIRNYASMSNDYLNVWSMLWLAGVSQTSRDVTFFNIDGIKRGRYFADMPNQFFRTYNVSFRRILRAADFADTKSTLCFKKLLMQPRPVLQFGSEGSEGTNSGSNGGKCTPVPVIKVPKVIAGTERDGSSNPTGLKSAADDKTVSGISSLFQRWNLQVRQNYNLLTAEALPSPTVLRVLLISRSAPTSGPNSTHILSRMFTNTQELQSALQTYAAQKSLATTSLDTTSNSNATTTGFRVEVTHSVFGSLSYLDQVRSMSETSIVIGMHGAGIASSIHMPVGTALCCGIAEIFPEGEFKTIKGYSSHARKLGHQYERINVAPAHTSLQGTAVAPELVTSALDSLIGKIVKARGSCFLPEVLNVPYL